MTINIATEIERYVARAESELAFLHTFAGYLTAHPLPDALHNSDDWYLSWIDSSGSPPKPRILLVCQIKEDSEQFKNDLVTLARWASSHFDRTIENDSTIVYKTTNPTCKVNVGVIARRGEKCELVYEEKVVKVTKLVCSDG